MLRVGHLFCLREVEVQVGRAGVGWAVQKEGLVGVGVEVLVDKAGVGGVVEKNTLAGEGLVTLGVPERGAARE